MSRGCLRFCVLGPVELWRDRQPAGPAGPKRRGLLAMLALRANDVVPAGDLIDGLWAGDPPPSAANLVQTYVSAWRKALDPGRGGRSGGRLLNVGPGYRLRIEPGELDLEDFIRELASGRSAAAAGEHHLAAERLAAALGLWRGPPLADVAGLPFHLAAAARLEELRLQAVEAWSAAALRTGRAGEVFGVVRDAREREPLRERLSELLMWALFQDGRQAEALAVYDQTRRVLAGQLGADPGTALRDMHARVLRQDPDLGPASAPARKPRLPVPADSFVGRDRELAEVAKLLEVHRLVTLTGPGGVGKTRLATEAAAALEARPGEQEVVFVDASPLSDADLIPDRLAHALGVTPAPGRSAADALAGALASVNLLVVLDNLEHLPGAAAVVARLLQYTPGLRLLATSRVPLRARGEHLYPVPPLELPSGSAGRGVADAPAAVALFADRAAAADPAFGLADDVGVVAEICQRLDGLPLAIELAARWVRVLPPAALLERLDRCLDLLSDDRGDRARRQQTMRSAIDWSYRLLTERVRQTFRALAVFAGGWSLAAAASVCGRGDEAELLSELAALADASLIMPVRTAAGTPRFRMLETLRHYGLEQLAVNGERERCRDRHAAYVHTLAAANAPQLTGPRMVSSLDMLEAERDNIGAALRWLGATGQAGKGLRTGALLWRFWHLRGHLEEGRVLLETLLSAPASHTDPAAHADGLSALGSVAYWQLDYETAERCYQQALAGYDQEGDRAGTARSHYDLGFTAIYVGASESARRHFSQALAGYEHLGDPAGRANALAGLALADRMTGHYDQARQRAAESLAELRRLGDDFGAVNSLSLLGSITSRMGQPHDAEALLREALAAHDRAGNVSGIIWMLHELAETATSLGQPQRAARLAGATQALEGELGGGIGVHALGLTRHLQPDLPQDAAARAELARQRGRLMNREEAVAAGLSDT